MHNPESVLENETQNILWDFEIQTDHLISVRRPDLMILLNSELYHSGWPQVKTEGKWKER